MFSQKFLEEGQFLNTRSAVGGPHIDDDDFAPMVCEVEFRSVNELGRKICQLITDLCTERG